MFALHQNYHTLKLFRKVYISRETIYYHQIYFIFALAPLGLLTFSGYVKRGLGGKAGQAAGWEVSEEEVGTWRRGPRGERKQV